MAPLNEQGKGINMLRELKEEDQEALLALNNASTPAVNPLTLEELKSILSIAIKGNEIVECDVQKNLKIVDLTGAGDLFAAGFLHGHVNN